MNKAKKAIVFVSIVVLALLLIFYFSWKNSNVYVANKITIDGENYDKKMMFSTGKLNLGENQVQLMKNIDSFFHQDSLYDPPINFNETETIFNEDQVSVRKFPYFEDESEIYQINFEKDGLHHVPFLFLEDSVGSWVKISTDTLNDKKKNQMLLNIKEKLTNNIEIPQE